MNSFLEHQSFWTSAYRGAAIAALLLASGCAGPFERPSADRPLVAPGGDEILARTVAAHSAGAEVALADLNVSLSGHWNFLIRRIQPLVTDYKYRVDSQERLLVGDGVYSALYQGPAGSKKVVRTRDGIRVFYDGVESTDEDVLQSTAMTADGFYYFLLGALAFQGYDGSFSRLPNVSEDGREYFRIHTVLEPGFGLSERDEVILWVDVETEQTYRMHITLEGYRTTRGAHADVTFLAMEDVDGYLLPTRFHERVVAPLGIDAHSWSLTGLDINRGLSLDEVDGADWSGGARSPAAARAE